MREGGCKAVKLEGGVEVVEDVKAILNAGIPVMGHLGYTPQSINVFGGHKAQGKTLDTARKILKDALALQAAGVFSIVLECVPYRVAEFISKRLDIPTIGIGSGAGCDGQVLVTPDIIGLFRDFTPRHTKKYADMGGALTEAAKAYIIDVTEGAFPTEKNSFIVEDEVMRQLEKEM